MEAFWAAPPISRTLAATALLLSISVYSGLLPGYSVIFYPDAILTIPPQLWRLFTPFLITGKELGIIFDTYFIYQYGSRLESGSSRFENPGDFITYIIFVCTFILGFNILFTGGAVFTSALVLAFAYTSSQDDRGQKATFFVITIPAIWVPYAMLLMNLVMAGLESTKIQATGLIAAHLHDFLTRLWPTFGGGRNLLQTPEFLHRLWDLKSPMAVQRSYGTMFTNKGTRNAAPLSRSSENVLPKSWQNRGSGHRLGGN